MCPSIYRKLRSFQLDRWPRIALVMIFSMAASLTANCAYGEPFADWTEMEGLSKANRDLVLGLRKSRVPDKIEVPFPKYSDAKLLSGDPKPIATIVASEPSPQTGVLLVSKASLVEVVRWYEERLPTYSRFEFAVDGSRHVLFISGCKDFDYQRDSAVLATKPHVIVSVLTPALKALAPGYETVIELKYEQHK